MKKQKGKADQAKIRQRKHIAFRMNFLFFSIFLLFSMLILRLGYLQIVKGEDYSKLLERKEEIAVNTSVPRGRLFDREGRVMVGNKPLNAITYTKTLSTTSLEMLDVARELTTLIDKDQKRITLSDKKDYWILLHPDEADEKVSAAEESKIKEDSELTKKDVQHKVNNLTRERITDEELNSFTDDELKVLAIYREMMSGYAYSPQIIKNEDVTEAEFAAVSERLDVLPGVDTTTDWDRVKISNSSILGVMTSPIEGIPKSHLNYYLARDYSRNDRVGRSNIEAYYEELLKGQKTIVKNIKDRSGRVVETKTVREGEPGKDLVLSIDSELQANLENQVSDKLLELKAGPHADILDRAFLVMMNPNTGEVLSMVGKQVVKNKDTGKFEVRDFTYGVFSTSYEMGSTVKMGTLLTGYRYGAAYVGENKIDEPIYLKGPLVKSSLFNRNSRMVMSDVEAIGRSSNSFMFKVAMGLANYNYIPHSSFNIDFDAFNKLRDGYASLGLGVMTGIDLPGEINGQIAKINKSEPGKLLDLAIGQYDTYTPLQLAQYVSTIANGGYRMAPKLLKEIRDPSPDGDTFGPLIQETETKVLNRIENTDEQINQIKKGMYNTYYGANGTARGLFNGADFDAGGKTGTAQTAYYEGTDRSLWGTQTVSVVHVGFAPFENPEIAYAIVFPHVSTSDKPPHPNNQIAQSAVNLYFQLKKERAMEENESIDIRTIKPPFVEKTDK